MDFLDPKKKKKHRIQLFIGYGLVAIAIGITTMILALVTNGYGFDRDRGEIIQNGLVFVGAHPESARMYINGADKGNSDGRFILEEGDYTLELQRDGYRAWKNDFRLEGGSIERFVYPYLFPQKLTTKDLRVYDATPDMVTFSPDRHWIVSHVPSQFNTFFITDTSTEANLTTSIEVPASILASRPNSKLEMVEWSTDNQHVLLKNTYEGGFEYIVLDRENPAESLNVTTILGRSPTQVALRDKKFNQIYTHDANGLLETADLRTKVVNVVAQKVLAFFPYSSDTVLYATDSAAPEGKVLVKMLQGDTTHTLRMLSKSPTYLLNIAQFDGDTYVVAGSSADSSAYVYSNPVAELKKNKTVVLPVKALLKVTAPAQYVSFSANARFVALQGGSKFAIYDAENNRQFKYDTGFTLANNEKATWMDGHRLTLVSQNKLRVFDFDGTNKQELNAVFAGTPPMFDRDYTALFTLSPATSSTNKAALARTELLLNK